MTQRLFPFAREPRPRVGAVALSTLVREKRWDAKHYLGRDRDLAQQLETSQQELAEQQQTVDRRQAALDEERRRINKMQLDVYSLPESEKPNGA